MLDKTTTKEIAIELMATMEAAGATTASSQKCVVRHMLYLVEIKGYDTYSVLAKLYGLDLSAKRIAQKYPTLGRLACASLPDLMRIQRVGPKTLQKVYTALIGLDIQPLWMP